MFKFLQVMSVIAVGQSIPLLVMWALGKFVGQQPAPNWAKQIIFILVYGGGLAVTGLNALFAVGDSYAEWMLFAWCAGALVSAWVVLAESQSDANIKGSHVDP